MRLDLAGLLLAVMQLTMQVEGPALGTGLNSTLSFFIIFYRYIMLTVCFLLVSKTFFVRYWCNFIS